MGRETQVDDVIQKFDVQLAADQEIPVEPLITLRPRGGVALRLTQRTPESSEISVG